MSKEQKRKRITEIENTLAGIEEKQRTIQKLHGEMQRPDRTLGLKVFTSIRDSDEDYDCKQVWFEQFTLVTPEALLKLYEISLEEKTKSLTIELNTLIS